MHCEGNAEVGDERGAIVQQNIFRLDVAMNDVLTMRVVERTRDFTRDANRVGNRQLSLAFQSCAQRFARYQRHDVIQQAIRLTAVE